ncbi:MAG: ATP-binding protein [Acidobacteriota bacterium]|nr:ATP-binding protein [Blastocatellia bacterium]MDW8413445.1 ATP-binding protein [Acidobacteriota bacterium]
MRNKLIWLIASRLTITLVLLGTSSILNILTPVADLVNVFIGTTLIVGLISIIYGLAIKLFSSYAIQAYFQIVVDILIVSFIVYRTIAIEKSFAALYLVVVLAASIVLSRVGVLATAAACVFSYLVILLAVYYGFAGETTYLMPEQSAPLYIIAMLVIGIVGGQISERLRSSNVELDRAAKHLANLQAFNERIIESIHSGLVTTDLSGRILSFNRAAEELTGFKASQVINRHLFDIFPEVRQEISFEEVLSKPKRFTVVCASARGKQMHLGMTTSPLSGEIGDMRGLVVSFQDLTEIIKLEQEIRRRDRLAAMGKIAAGIAHEIRNPLAAMRGSIQLLQSELELNEDQAHLMAIVLRESDRLDKIVSDFLAYARPAPINIEEFDLTSLVKETVSLVCYSAEYDAKQHRLVTDLPSSLQIRADPNQLRQVVWNLAKNALQAMPYGGTLTISVKLLGEEDVELRVRDTGVGMKPEELERIFEPFNSSKQGGTGLGLAIVYQIVSDHKGQISVDSVPEQGTTFTIILPKARVLHPIDTLSDAK